MFQFPNNMLVLISFPGSNKQQQPEAPGFLKQP